MVRPTLQFLGGVGTVTGSRFLVRTDRATVMVDAGLFQGLRELRRSNWEPFPVDPATIDAVVVTHAHIDHSGWLPGLVRDGFTGPIFTTRETIDLCSIVLPDSAHLQEEQARFANERGFSRHHPALPLYTSEDVEATLPMFVAVPYQTATEVATDIHATLVPAGHILGSASVHLRIESGLESYSLLVSGDLGRGDHPLVPGPSRPPSAETVLVESTYGGSTHPDERDEEEAIAAFITSTAARGGHVLIPAFAVDRTELVLLLLRRLMTDGRIPRLPVYADSPMALKVLETYRAAAERADPLVVRPGSLEDFDPGAGLHRCRTVEESMALNDLRLPAIIISASGMATGGRVLHHLKRLLPDHRNGVLLCGYQAEGTRGRSLLDGASSVKLHGRYIPVRAEVCSVTSMSVHADADDLCAWIGALDDEPDAVYVVHGEQRQSAQLAGRLRGIVSSVVVVPEQFERVQLAASSPIVGDVARR